MKYVFVFNFTSLYLLCCLQRQKTRGGRQQQEQEQQKSAYAISGFMSFCMDYLKTFVVNRSEEMSLR